MPKRWIGIDIGRNHVCAAQVVRTAEGFHVEKAFAAQTRRSTDSLPAILHALTNEHGFDRRAEAAVCLPLHVFFFADVETDTEGWERIRAGDTAGLKDYFPIPADDLVAQVCSVRPTEGGKLSTLVAAASRQQLSEDLPRLYESRMKPACLDTPITAAHTTLVMNHPESTRGLAVLLYVDPATLSLAVTHEGSILLVRNIPMLTPGEQTVETFAQQTAETVAQEIEITWKRLFGNDPDPGLRIYVIAPRPLAPALASSVQDKTNGRVIPVDPYASVTRGEEVDPNLPLCVAQGLALRGLQPEGTDSIDFLAAYRARTRPTLRLRKELTVCAAMAAAAVVVWAAGLFLQWSSLESNYRDLKRQTEEVFHAALPEEQTMVDPVAQLQQRLEAFRKDNGALASRPAPLEILYALSRNTPTVGALELQEVLTAANSVRITGSCDSYATFSQWQRLLETIPGFRVDDVPRSTKDPRGRVQFLISLSLHESKA